MLGIRILLVSTSNNVATTDLALATRRKNNCFDRLAQLILGQGNQSTKSDYPRDQNLATRLRIVQSYRSIAKRHDLQGNQLCELRKRMAKLQINNFRCL